MKDVWKVLGEVQDVWKDQEMQDVWKVHGKGVMLDMVWYDIQEAELVEVQDSWQEVQEDHGEVQDLQP